jgi:DinB superfamily
MRYMLLTQESQDALLESLIAMPDVLDKAFGRLSTTEARIVAADGFSPVEQCWHLADLERDGYSVRIRRLLNEDEPALPDFDGERVARERDYKSLSLTEGLAAFRQARAENVAALRRLSESEWERRGTQEGVGRIGLCDVPAMMAEHDAAHRKEIEVWVAERDQVKGQRSKGKG